MHQFSNPGKEETQALIFLSPDIGAQFFRDVAEVVNVGGVPDVTRLVAIMSRYGLILAAPRA